MHLKPIYNTEILEYFSCGNMSDKLTGFWVFVLKYFVCASVTRIQENCLDFTTGHMYAIHK